MKKDSHRSRRVGKQFQLLARCSLCVALFLSGASVHSQSKQKPSAPVKKPFSLGGEKLPVTEMSDWEGDVRNHLWQGIARLLRVRDLRVYDWPSAYNVMGEAQRQKQRTLAQVKAAGYTIAEFKWNWNINGYPPTTGFRAKRGAENLSALWGSNGSHLFLYWGHEVPQTPARKRDDKLIAAAIEGQTSKVESLLKSGADPRASDYAGASVLMLAVFKKRAAVVQQLLAALKPQSSIATSNDVTSAFIQASARNDLKTAQFFLDAGVTPRQIDEAFYVAATSYGTTEMARKLLPLASSQAVDKALIPAAYSGDWRGSSIQFPDVVKMLLERNPSQSALNAALLAASQNDESHLVGVLLTAGADVETRDGEGQTVLSRAARWGRVLDLDMKQILEHGANANARDNDGNTVLMWAAIGEESLQNTKLLLAHGADSSARNKKGKTAMDWVQQRIAKLPASSMEAMNYLKTRQLLKTAIETRRKQ